MAGGLRVGRAHFSRGRGPRHGLFTRAASVSGSVGGSVGGSAETLRANRGANRANPPENGLNGGRPRRAYGAAAAARPLRRYGAATARAPVSPPQDPRRCAAMCRAAGNAAAASGEYRGQKGGAPELTGKAKTGREKHNGPERISPAKNEEFLLILTVRRDFLFERISSRTQERKVNSVER